MDDDAGDARLGSLLAIRAERARPLVIMLTAGRATDDKVAGPANGADDWRHQAFEMKEGGPGPGSPQRCRSNGSAAEKRPVGLCLTSGLSDMDGFFELTVDGKSVDTPPKEMELAVSTSGFLSPNRVYTRNQLLDEVWGFDYFGDSRTVDVHVKRLREKLEGVSDQWNLKTVWGVGYKFEVLQQ